MRARMPWSTLHPLGDPAGGGKGAGGIGMDAVWLRVRSDLRASPWASVAGRLPRPDRANEAFLDPQAAASLHASVGSRLPMVTLTSVPDGFPDTPLGPSNFTYLTLTVAGIGVEQSAIRPANVLDAQPSIV